MRRSPQLLLSALCLTLLAACGNTTSQAEHPEGGSTSGAEQASAAKQQAPVASTLPDVNLLKDPFNPAMNQTAPDVFKTRFTTTKGDFVVEVHREWAPLGADRFYNLSKAGFFDGVKFFRAIKGFMVQFGIHGDPSVAKAWRSNTLRDDPVTQSNKPGYITYAKTGAPHSRSTQYFINYGDNAGLDAQGFAPFGKVVEGMDIVNSLYNKYGETASKRQSQIQTQGNAFLEANFPELDSIISARLVD